MLFKYGVEDMEFNELNFEFVKEYEFYLKTVKNNAIILLLNTLLILRKLFLLQLIRNFLSRILLNGLNAEKLKVPKKAFNRI